MVDDHLVAAIGTEGCPYDFGKFIDGLNVAKHGFLDTLEVLVPSLKRFWPTARGTFNDMLASVMCVVLVWWWSERVADQKLCRKRYTHTHLHTHSPLQEERWCATLSLTEEAHSRSCKDTRSNGAVLSELIRATIPNF